MNETDNVQVDGGTCDKASGKSGFSGGKGKSNKRRNKSKANSGKRGASNGFRAIDQSDRKATVLKESFNDVSWYAGSQQLLTDSASLPYSEVIGGKVNLGIPTIINNAYNNDDSFPGILFFDVSLIPGISNSPFSAVNTAAYQLFATVRKANSGKTNYEALDLMMYVMAVDNILAFHAFVRRAYSLLNGFSPYSRFIPQSLIEGMGFDFDDLVAHQADLRYILNTMAAKINTLSIPAYMPILVRHEWMFKNIYRDSESDKSQLYCFNPRGFFVYNPTKYKSGTALEYKFWDASTKHKVFGSDSILEWFQTLINAIYGDTDASTMAGDIRKAFPENTLVQVSEIDSLTSIEPVYNYEIIGEIQNLTTVGTLVGGTYPGTGENINDIFQVHPSADSGSNPFINYNPHVIQGNDPRVPDSRRYILNSYHSDPRPEDTMINTRLMACTTRVDDAEGNYCLIKTCGTEIVHRMRLALNFYHRSGGAGTTIIELTTDHKLLEYGGTGIDPYIVLHDWTQYTQLSVFDRHPFIYFLIGTYNEETKTWDDTKQQLVQVFGDVDNYTTVGADELEPIHSVAIQSEFGLTLGY